MTPYVADPVYLNGRFLPLAEAGISPLDRGFLFGDGVYEVIPVYSRRPFRIDEHLRRLQDSLDGIRLANPLSNAAWQGVVERLVADAEFPDQSVYLQVTRGADDKRDQAFPIGVAPTGFAFTSPLVAPSDALREAGVGAITVPDIRWAKCDLKAVSLLANVLLRQQAVEAGCAEAIMLREGCLTEGAASNIFVVKAGVILTPPKNNRILPGITYDVVFELANKHGVPNQQRPITEAELFDADEIWVTSSTKEILPVTTLNGKPVGKGDAAGKVGPVAQKLHKAYVDFRDALVAASKNA